MDKALVRRAAAELQALCGKGDLVRKTETSREIIRRETPRGQVNPDPLRGVNEQREARRLPSPQWSAQGAMTQGTHAPIELPRLCAIYDGELWLARYEWRNGRYEYSNSAVCPQYQQGRYSQENIITLPGQFSVKPEKCACCQTWSLDCGQGSVLCGRCNKRVCCGRTSPDRYFKCRASCGHEGYLVPMDGDTTGLVPGRIPGNFGIK